MRSKVQILVAALVLFVGCSGGGGSDDGGGSKSNAVTGVRILHGAVDLPPVTSASTTAQIDQARFYDDTRYGAVSFGEQVLSLTSAGGGEGFTFPVTVKKGERRSLLVYGTRETFGIHATLLEDFPPTIDSASANIRIVHALAGAATLKGNVGGISLLSSVSFGEGSEYITVPAGSVRIALSRGVDGKPLISETRTLEGKRSYTFFATGEVGFLVMTRVMEDR